jgi:hypothetical protein
MNTLEMRNTVNQFMRLMKKLEFGSRLLTNHSLISHPESLLPLPKTYIQEALIKAIQMARRRRDRIQLRGLEHALLFLQTFIPDHKATADNERLLSNTRYWKEIETQERIERNLRHDH